MKWKIKNERNILETNQGRRKERKRIALKKRKKKKKEFLKRMIKWKRKM